MLDRSAIKNPPGVREEWQCKSHGGAPSEVLKKLAWYDRVGGLVGCRDCGQVSDITGAVIGRDISFIRIGG